MSKQPLFMALAAGSYTNKSNDFVLVYTNSGAVQPILVAPQQTITVASGGATALQGKLEDLRGYF